MIELNDEKIFYAFSDKLTPALTVDSGETIRIRTQDCFGNQLKSPADKMDGLDWDRTNPATGPIFVRGAVAGGCLQVKIENIEFDPHAVACTGENEGVCGDHFTAWSTLHRSLDENGLKWSDGVTIPLRPMIGVIGVAPAGEPINCGTPGTHGGNMDNTAITKGATIYFPVVCDGALFGLGDMHSVMGDGEIGVSGAETAGYATVTLTAQPDLHLINPVMENATHFITIASANSLDEAASIAVHDMLDIVHERTGAPEDELAMLFSMVADVRVCQMVDPLKTVRFEMPKYVLDSYGFKFI